MKTSKELRQRIKSIISNIPRDICQYYSNYPYELIIYIKRGDDDFDIDDFTTFKGIKELDKSINKIIDNYKEKLYCIDFKWSMKEDDYDQFTIYKN